MKYEMDKNNHQDWLNKGPWYNPAICIKFHGSMFEDIMTHKILDRYNLMCSLVLHDKIQPACEYDESIIADRSIHKNETIESFKSLGGTLNFIDTWLKLFEDIYYARRVSYITAMKEMFKKIPQTMS